jgi:putative ABC transport system permease protein
MSSRTEKHNDHFDAFKNDLLLTNAVERVAASSTPVTETRTGESSFDWVGKATSGNTQNFTTVGISKDFGKTVGWRFVAGRDYESGPEGSDALAFVLNESAAKLMGFKDPIGKKVHWSGYTFTIIGVVKDMVMSSPFDPVDPAIFYMAPWRINVYNMRLSQHVSVTTAVDRIAAVFKKFSPADPLSTNLPTTSMPANSRSKSVSASCRGSLRSSLFLSVASVCLG